MNHFLLRSVQRQTPRHPRPYRFPVKGAYVWGSCDRGQLGLGHERASQPTPARLPLPVGHEFIEIVGGPNTLFARTSQNRWFGWGVGTTGAFGDRRRANYAEPTYVEDMDGATEIACGGYHTLVHIQGDSYACGMNTGGCLGLGDLVPEFRLRKISDLRGKLMRQLVAGVDFSLFLTERHRTIYAAGKNDVGQLGLGHQADSRQVAPISTLSGVPISSLSSGWGHTLALSEDGVVYSWGANKHGQCGLGHNFNVLEPKEVTVLKDKGVIQVSAGGTHSVALTEDGHVYMWGSCGDGKLGVLLLLLFLYFDAFLFVSGRFKLTPTNRLW